MHLMISILEKNKAKKDGKGFLFYTGWSNKIINEPGREATMWTSM